MKAYKLAITAGISLGAVGLIVLIYNFFNMYSLAAECPENLDLAACQAYKSWELINVIGLALLVISVIVLTTGFILKRKRS